MHILLMALEATTGRVCNYVYNLLSLSFSNFPPGTLVPKATNAIALTQSLR